MAIKQIGRTIATSAQGVGDIVESSAETIVSSFRSTRLTLGVVEESLQETIIEAVRDKAHTYINAVKSFESAEEQQIFLQAVSKYKLF